jgi:hypothetical protein
VPRIGVAKPTDTTREERIACRNMAPPGGGCPHPENAIPEWHGFFGRFRLSLRSWGGAADDQEAASGAVVRAKLFACDRTRVRGRAELALRLRLRRPRTAPGSPSFRIVTRLAPASVAHRITEPDRTNSIGTTGTRRTPAPARCSGSAACSPAILRGSSKRVTSPRRGHSLHCPTTRSSPPDLPER